MFNTTRKMSTTNTVESMLQNLGAEPLFSSVSDPSSSSPTSLNDVKISPATYSAQQYSSQQYSSPDIIATLVQRLNEQQKNLTPQIPNEEVTMGYGSNPISILNEIHQRERRSSVPPRYSFTVDLVTGRFHCQLEIFGKVFKTEQPTVKKQQAKEEAALKALRYVTNENSSSNDGTIVNNFIENLVTDTVCKSESWYKKQSQDFPTKQFRVLLLEFCQMHHLPSPKYQLRNDETGRTLCDCIIGDRIFQGDNSFIKSNDAKDYVANLAFLTMYKEFCEVEKSLIRKRQGNGQETRSSLATNFIESHTPSNSSSSLNINGSSVNKISSNHLLLTYGKEVPNIKVEESHVEMPNIKLEEGSINSNYSHSYSKRNQHPFTSSSTTSFHPYQRPSKNAGYKKFTSLLYEMAQSERWVAPEFTYENGVNGFVCIASINNYLFRGKACSRKMDAKESASEEAYEFLIKHHNPPQRHHSMFSPVM